MSSEDHSRARELFLKACGLAPEARSEYLREACSDDDLRREVEALLQFDRDPTSVADPGEVETRPWEFGQPPPERIGNYRLLSKVGEGGMGEVWEAEQEHPVRRRVALKLIRWGMNSEEIVARFESERQALALMDHPNIAHVLDAGATPEGRPYFVMEFVRGVPITDYCDSQRLTTEERLALIIQVCAGVQHAHLKGVIHRDVKPNNILVTLQDGEPVPKLIDFGVAKATAQRLTERTVFTELGQWIGTPAYMSPEQAGLTGQDVDSRTDVYSLGVVAYELLAGTQPYDVSSLRRAGLDEIRRLIREDDPPRPSTRVSGLGEASEIAARQRRTDRAGLVRTLRGDLDWIVMKALEKSPIRRYGTPAELARDIERHLDHQPVLARSPSGLYRAGKFVRRNRLGVVAATLVLASMLLGTAASTIGFVRAKREAETARQVSAFLVGIFSDVNPAARLGGVTTPEAILTRGVERIETELVGQPLVQARLMTTVAFAFASLGRNTEAHELHERAVAIRRKFLDVDDPDLLLSLSGLADVLINLGDFDESRRLHEMVLEARIRTLGPEDPTVAWSLRSLGAVEWNAGDLDAALDRLQRALRLNESTLGEDHQDTANTLSVIAGVELDRGNYESARAATERVLRIREATLGPEHTRVGDIVFQLGLVHQRTGEPEAAKALYKRAIEIQEKALGENHPAVAFPLNELGVLHISQGDTELARPLIERALAIREKTLGSDHAHVAWSLSALAYLEWESTGDLEASRALYERALKVQRRALSPVHYEISRTLGFIAELENLVGNHERARRLHEEQLEIRREIFGEGHRRLAIVFYNLGRTRALQGEPEEALALLQQSLDCGFSSRTIFDDPSLSSLRGDPRLEVMVAEVQRRIESEHPRGGE